MPNSTSAREKGKSSSRGEKRKGYGVQGKQKLAGLRGAETGADGPHRKREGRQKIAPWGRKAKPAVGRGPAEMGGGSQIL